MTLIGNHAPDTLARPRDWMNDANCASSAHLMHPAPGDLVGRKQARSLCDACPVRAQCLTEAMRLEGSAGEASRAGIQGGMDERERWRLYRAVAAGKRGPSRRKTTAASGQ